MFEFSILARTQKTLQKVLVRVSHSVCTAARQLSGFTTSSILARTQKTLQNVLVRVIN